MDGKDFIIDPGMGATEWVIEHVRNPVAILNTHGHFDHVWSNAELKKRFGIPVVCPKKDAFMLESDPFGQGTPGCLPDCLPDGDETVNIAGEEIRFRHFPGHTPGNSVIEIGKYWFSGDFIFRHSIGRWDFPYSDGAAMAESLRKAIKIDNNYLLYPGHGPSTTLAAEQRYLPAWIKEVEKSV